MISDYWGNMKLINPEVRIENTNSCNAKCIICPREKMTRPLMTMNMRYFRELVDEVKAMGAKTISIFGYGEPLLDKGLASKIQYCTDKRLQTFITTNASLLTTTKSDDILNAGLSHIRFSVHGTYHNYKKVHGLDFMPTLRNIRNFICMNDDKYNHRCKVSMSVIPLHNETVDYIRGFWEPVVDWLEIWKPHNWTDGKDFRKVKQTKKRKKTCGRPFNGPLQINSDGKVMVCCFDYDAKLTVGNTRTHTLEEILKGEKFSEIRRKHADGNLKGLICETCDQLNENDDPLLYSSRDSSRQIGMTSSTKFKIGE